MIQPLVVLLVAVAAIGVAASCSAPGGRARGSAPASGAAGPASAPAARGVIWTSIAHLGHGLQARFATCSPPACPVVTAKTLAVEPPVAPTPVVAAPDPAPAMPPRPVEWVVTEVVVSFAFGRAALTPAARAAIDAAAATDGIRRIDIRGRTDNVGPSAANEALAHERAAAVAQHLRSRHPRLSTAELNVDAQGLCCYAADNDSPAGRARNRRVEIRFGREPSDL